MTIHEYISEIQRQFATGVAREHTYRPALQQLLATLLPQLVVSNEPARQACGAPDYILQRKEGNVPVAFVEAKDIGDSDLGGRKQHKEQFERYRTSLDNIIFTDYLDFWLYENGEFVESVRIAELRGDKIVPLKENFAKFESLIIHFGNAQPQRITSPAKLAEIMAAKARLLADVIEQTLERGGGDGNLEGQMTAFKDVLIHDITPKEFADVYAQTIAYGMFAARLHDTTPDNFSRQEAAALIPKTNPFLRRLFQDIAGYDLDERIRWIVDDLAETFRVTDMAKVMAGFGQRTQQTDPMIHFYEDFLSAYDPRLRKSRGVWYTPQAVVSFIVRAVDEILQTEFGLSEGLADTSKIKMRVANQKSVKRGQADSYDIDVHRVQILDPATGTGTFLAETVSRIHERFAGQAGMWQSYVEQHLLPRLNGFELLMASYTMAHLKLDMLLTETGYKAVNNERLRIFLTNSLEEHHKDTGTLFAQFLAREANGADTIKRDTPVMVVMGNPPYSGTSSNKGEWISRMINDYKYVDGQYFNERKHWLNDDYVKFIRLGQYFVDKNTEGVLAYINNHSFIDNPTFRGMRWNLMRSFDKIYIIDLHGNSKKKETAPDGSKDENVFDIQQGVSINLFVKTGRKPVGGLAEVYHYDLFGKRQTKYDYLLANNLTTVPFKRVEPTAPFYFMMPKDEDNRTEYEQGFRIDELMSINTSGIVSMGDSFAFANSKTELQKRLQSFLTQKYTLDQLNDEFSLGKNYADFVIHAKPRLFLHDDNYVEIATKPFDKQWTYFSNNVLWRPRTNVMRNFIAGENIGLVVSRQCVSDWRYVFCTKRICEFNLTGTAGRFGSGYAFPLYLYPDHGDLLSTGRTPNLDPKIVGKIAEGIGLEFEAEKSGDVDKFAPIDLLDYIYAVLHSPAYRAKYREFLKIDFPRVPYPASASEFRRLASLGGELRRIHLMEHPVLSALITRYPATGSNTVEKTRWEPDANGTTGRVWLNDTQYFDSVPVVAWEFYIGGYQPAQKWLKDRRGHTLSFDDTRHYQRIIKALAMTDEIVNRID
ncbi:MAG: N-6 DNA methylase [Rikenellaceae bacterium]|jgi:predicted helicase|nr:N-6 DNA methylase [Rikenellaceae bacterium]